jgi:hypothetical protein
VEVVGTGSKIRVVPIKSVERPQIERIRRHFRKALMVRLRGLDAPD